MKIVTYNVNGIRASIKLGLLDWLKEYNADIYCIQEVRCNENLTNELIFDSIIDSWNEEISIFNEKIFGKSKLAFIIEDEDDELFGYYCNTEIIEQFRKDQQTDNQTFEFNLKSSKRLSKPMKFEIKNSIEGGIFLHDKSDECLISMGDICIWKEKKKYESFCVQIEYRFDYHEIHNALCGKEPNEEGEMYFIPKRILVIQMK